VRTIHLSRGKVAIVDADDYLRLRYYKWYVKVTVRVGRTIYYAVRLVYGPNRERRPIYMHRAIMNAKRGRVVDHINGNGLDNRRTNLRLCTHQENSWNTHSSRSLSGARGVHFLSRLKGKPWAASIYVSHKIHLGYFATRDEAVVARAAGEKLYFGRFAPYAEDARKEAVPSRPNTDLG
jgi:hypothetical protein